MNCDDVRPQLTAYLDGELEDDRGSAVRGHLRGCDACRTAADDEALLRDGLRELPALDVPASLWAGVQQRLAEAEVHDAELPRWRRAVQRWSATLRPANWMTPRFALASSAVAVIVCVWAWRYSHREVEIESTGVTPVAVAPHVAPVPTPPPDGNDGDVATEIAALPKQTSDSYAQAAAELATIANEARAQWPADRQHTFDTTFAELAHTVDAAAEGRERHKAYRALIRYLERVTTRDEVAFADTRGGL